LEYFEFEKWAACAVCAATGKILTPEFDGFFDEIILVIQFVFIGSLIGLIFSLSEA
jgi:hypothetical protein